MAQVYQNNLSYVLQNLNLGPELSNMLLEELVAFERRLYDFFQNLERLPVPLALSELGTLQNFISNHSPCILKIVTHKQGNGP